MNSLGPSGTSTSRSPVTGGGLSQNGKFSYGYASSPGKRSSMEDFYETRIDGVDGEVVGLFGVFDGHGGVRAAEYVKKNLFSNLIRHPKFISDTKSAIADAYNHTDSEFLKSENSQNKDAGSTASTAILVGDRLLVANVGDSRAVICRGGKAIAVSRDHKPDRTDERQRIEDAGGFVIWAGTWRVGGVLAVSRAFGDRLLKQYVVADPEINEEVVDDSLEFLILASDGLWDVVSNEEAVAMVKPIDDPEEAARRLMQEAYQRGSADNITCVVVRFLDCESSNADRDQRHGSNIEKKQCQPSDIGRDQRPASIIGREQSQVSTGKEQPLASNIGRVQSPAIIGKGQPLASNIDSAQSPAIIGKEQPLASIGKEQPLAGNTGRAQSPAIVGKEQPLASSIGREQAQTGNFGRPQPLAQASNFGTPQPLASNIGREEPQVLSIGRPQSLASTTGREQSQVTNIGMEKPQSSNIGREK